MDKAKLTQMKEYWDQKADKAYMNYQETGIQRYANELNKAQDLSDALGIAVEAESDHALAVNLKIEFADFASRAEGAVGRHDTAEMEEILRDLVNHASARGIYRRVEWNDL